MADQNISTTSKPVSKFWDGQVDGIDKVSVVTEQMRQIEITDRAWHQLPFNSEVVMTSNGMVASTVETMGTVSLGSLMGIPPNNATDSTISYIATWTGDEVRDYIFF